jgi:hypothetical protein
LERVAKVPNFQGIEMCFSFSNLEESIRGSSSIMTEHSYATEDAEVQQLLSRGFSESEARKLIHMKDHVSEQIEYREMLEESRRLDFIRWLIEHDRISS